MLFRNVDMPQKKGLIEWLPGGSGEGGEIRGGLLFIINLSILIDFFKLHACINYLFF